MPMAEYPAFKLGKSRYDQSTFSGRLRHFIEVINPATIFTSTKDLNNSIRILQEYKDGTLEDSITNAQLWEAQRIKQAAIHPDTQEKIPIPFRMSGFVPFGTPVIVGLLLPNPGVAQTVFFQWLNQSHNACINYCNRNATSPTPTYRFVIGYIGAVGSSICIALALTAGIKRANGLSPAMKSLVQKFVPFPAVAAASSLNVVLMRTNELSKGITVMDRHDNVIGSSTSAAKKAIGETALTRCFLPAPILVIPPLIMTALEKTKFLKNNMKFHLPINALVCTVCFAVALPVTIAIFPQMSKINVKDLEQEIQDLTNEEVLYYNKGL